VETNFLSSRKGGHGKRNRVHFTFLRFPPQRRGEDGTREIVCTTGRSHLPRGISINNNTEGIYYFLCNEKEGYEVCVVRKTL